MMGERGNIVVNGVWMYTHWGGDRLKQTLKSALKRGKDRWTDAPYLARIVFCEMVQHEVLSTRGFGLSTRMTDNNYNILVVDVMKQKIYEHEENNEALPNEPEKPEQRLGKIVKTWSFKQFVALKLKEAR